MESAQDKKDNVKERLESIYDHYLKDPKTTILVVIQAMTDLQNSNAFKLAR